MGLKRKDSDKSIEVSANYLDYVPEILSGLKYESDLDGSVVIFMENEGLFNWIAQTFFNKPKVSKIHLDEMGNFIWPLVDGRRSILEISEAVKEHFGDKAEPLYPRLIKYIRTLESYGFIKINPVG